MGASDVSHRSKESRALARRRSQGTTNVICSLVFAERIKCVIKSRMNGDVQVRFCEQLRVKFPGLTRLSDSEAGAEASALFYSLVVTAKVNGVNPYEALKTLFAEIPKAKTIEDFELLANLFLTPALASKQRAFGALTFIQ
jgi:hypothetical protein